ncbi:MULTISPECIES: hypothetical protein [unclassified Streptomyces]|uniref:hypothetical protein n=1 Tax=unclassified Streptomyces TaxID=2593676 RepID=UPI003408BDF4
MSTASWSDTISVDLSSKPIAMIMPDMLAAVPLRSPGTTNCGTVKAPLQSAWPSGAPYRTDGPPPSVPVESSPVAPAGGHIQWSGS